MSETVLVTGATGFIGKPLVARLRRQGLDVIAIGSAHGDLADPASLSALYGRGIRHVFHLAGRSFVPDSWNDPQGFVRSNVQGTLNVLELCRREAARLTFMSAYLYGVPDRLPIAEDAPLRPNNPYALSKRMAEEACSFYARQLGLAVTVLRPFNVYGPGQSERFLLPSVLRQLLTEKRVEVLDLEPRRDWLFVEDLIEAVVAASRHAPGYNVYNLGSGASLSVAELIRVAQEAAGTRLPVASKSTARVNEIGDTVADIGKARAVLGWSPGVTIHEGIRRCLNAMSENR